MIIPGGTSGIGLAIARAFREVGATVTIVGHDAERRTAAATKIDAQFERADCADPDAVEAVFNRAVEQMGGIDTVICTLGGNLLPDLLMNWTLSEIRTAWMGDVAPFLYCGTAALPHLTAAGGGALINVASDAGKIATPGEVVIGAGMAAIIQFTRGYALEGKRNGKENRFLCSFCNQQSGL